MNYPLISEYIESILNAEDNFDKLSHLRPVLNEAGFPIMSSGNFAVVFKMTDGVKYYAIKCFTKNQEGREEAYELISNELKDIESPYLVKFSFYKKELFVDSSQTQENEFSVVCMDWVEGVTLTEYINRYAESFQFLYEYTDGGLWTYSEYKSLCLEDLEVLARRFFLLGKWLQIQLFAHGDLKPDNILVRHDGTLVLVDYDGMFVSSMKGERRREQGSPDFTSPLQQEQFDRDIDDFSISLINLQLELIAADKITWLYNHSSFPLSKNDFLNISKSNTIKEILVTAASSPKCMRRLGEFLIVLSGGKIAEDNDVNLLLLEETFADINPQSTYTDKYGVTYSSDRKRLLKGISFKKSGHNIPEPYIIPEGTEVICDYAFWGLNIEAVIFPNSLKVIGKCAFGGTPLKWVNIPDSVYQIEDAAFSGCSAEYVIINGPFESIGERVFEQHNDVKISTKIILHEGVNVLGDRMFEGCFIESIVLPSTLKYINKNPFAKAQVQNIISYSSKFFVENNCLYNTVNGGYVAKSYLPREFSNNSNGISIKQGTVKIGANAFEEYDRKKIYLPESLHSIDKYAFINSRIIECVVPDSVWRIGDGAFSGCEELRQVKISSGCAFIGDETFYGCSELEDVYLPNELKSIGDDVFVDCQKLTNITIPQNVSQIGINSFCYPPLISRFNTSFIIKDECLIEITTGILIQSFVERQVFTIPTEVKILGKSCFAYRTNLQHLIIPEGVLTIKLDSFKRCDCLDCIELPSTINEIETDDNLPPFWSGNLFRPCPDIYIHDNHKMFLLLWRFPELRSHLFEVTPTMLSYDDRLVETSEDYITYSKDGKKLISYGDTCRSEFVIRDGVDMLCDYCMNDIDCEIECFSLEKVILPSSLKYIGENVFCRVEEIISNSPNFVTENGFLMSKDKTVLYRYFGNERVVLIPNSIRRISGGAFSSLDLEELYIPESVIEIGDNPFVDTNTLSKKSLVIHNRSKTFLFVNHMLINNSTKNIIAYLGVSERVRIPNGILTVGKHAFRNKQIKILALNDDLQYICRSAFYYSWEFLKVIRYNPITLPKIKSIIPSYLHSSLYGFNVNISGDLKKIAIKVNNCIFNFILVESGSFRMGENLDSTAFPDEISWFFHNAKNVHDVTISKSYYIAETPVTQELWMKIMNYNPSEFKENPLNPVENVSWHECQDFIKKLNEITGYVFDLPTEAEWEFAAKGGNYSLDKTFAGSDKWQDVAWCDDYRLSNKDHSYLVSLTTQPVKSKLPNELGIYDMTGNVWEWCKDWFAEYSNDSQIDPQGPSSGEMKVGRGGSYCTFADWSRNSSRDGREPNHKRNRVGFRLVLRHGGDICIP